MGGIIYIKEVGLIPYVKTFYEIIRDIEAQLLNHTEPHITFLDIMLLKANFSKLKTYLEMSEQYKEVDPEYYELRRAVYSLIVISLG